jgi:hypothetical protein
MTRKQLRKLIENVINEDENNNELYRQCSIRYVIKVLTNDFMPEGNLFTSLSLNKLNTKEFGDCLIIFNWGELNKENNTTKVEYNSSFMEEHPDICVYVTGFGTQDDYIATLDDTFEDEDGKKYEGYMLSAVEDELWDGNIENYKDEQEVVAPRLMKINDRCIKKIEVPIKYRKKIEAIKINIPEKNPEQLELFKKEIKITYIENNLY